VGVYLWALGSRQAATAASTMWAGVGKSGSPAPKPTTLSPAALSAFALASMARVADSATAPIRVEIRAMPAMLSHVPEPEVPDIAIPRSLLPGDGRFGSGPSKVRPEAVAALSTVGGTYLGTSHRQAGVRTVVGALRAGLSALFSPPEGYEVLLGNGGTTAFWDAATFGLVEERSLHLSFGEFSSKFAAAVRAAPHLADPVVVESPPGTHPVAEAVDGVDLYALTHNETSTGVAMEVRRPTGGGFVAVDATSAAGGLRVDPAEFDVYYFAPQKCFGSDGGLWLALCSPAAVARIESLSASGRWAPSSLDLKIALDNSRLDQTYNTPALATLFLMLQQVEWMLAEGGLEWAASRCDRSAETLYGWAEASSFATPFVEKPDERSHVVGTVDFDPSVDAVVLSKVLRANGIVDTESYRKLGRNQLRIAMFPAIDPDDVAALTACIDHVVGALS
jgi:phosphoserine aminotransferase